MAMSDERIYKKLCSIRTDLRDDSSHITTINTAIQNVADDFSEFIKSTPPSKVKGKVESLQEPKQSSDFNVQKALDSCDSEISVVKNRMSAFGSGGSMGGR